MKANIQKKVLYVILILISVLTVLPGNPDTSFKWAVITEQKDGIVKTQPPSDPLDITENDRFRFYFRPDVNCYVYLYFLDSHNNLSRIFPDTFEYTDEIACFKDTEYFIPGKSKGFTMAPTANDSKTKERFYLLVSKTRLTKLDELTFEFNRLIIKDPDSSAHEKLLVLREQILDEIKRHKMVQGVIEKPTTISGGVRAGDKKNERMLTQVEANDVYKKTLIITH